MKKPLAPPAIHKLMQEEGPNLGKILAQQSGPTLDGHYCHWDELRHREPPPSLTHAQWWLSLKVARISTQRFLPLTDQRGRPFHLVLTPLIQEALHVIDSRASGRIAMPEPVTQSGPRERFLVRSLVEEAITSSQLEGASTTRRQAMEMIRSGRTPINRSERMILNNLAGMRMIREHKDEELTPDLVFEIHRAMTKATLPSDEIGRLQHPNEQRIHVASNTTGEILHEPPPADLLPERLQAMCNFANRVGETEFLHPVIRAILLHLWLAYDHPFTDGNGRTARALFYWLMLREGYWLFEFISISTILRRASAQYGRSYLYTETDDNDATYFVIFQLKTIRRALETLEKYLAKKTREIQAAESALRDMGKFNYRQLALLSHALRNPDSEYTLKSHGVSHDVAYATARSDLLELVERGLLESRKIAQVWHFFPSSRLTDLHRQQR